MKRTQYRALVHRLGLVPAFVGVVALISAAGGSPAGADVTSVGGGAFGEQIRGLLVNSGPVPTVGLPAGGGGPFVSSLLTVNVPGTLRTGVLEVRTAGALGDSGFSQSSATVANVLVGTGVVTADAVKSQCRSDSTGSSGSTTLTNAAVGGIVVDASVPANTSINLSPVARVFLNEQIVNNTPGNSSITVNAVRVVLLPGSTLQQEIIIAQSRCSARLAPATTTTHVPTTVGPTTSTTHSPAFP